jgi:hydrogenase expression/formation protein HypC
MCLGIPGRVVELESEGGLLPHGVVQFGGIRKRVCLAYVPEVKIGEYVIVHVGFAIGTMDEEEAVRVFALLEEMDALAELEDPDCTAESGAT